MKNIVIAGSGGFARETKWLLDRVNCCDRIWNFLGYISTETEQKDVIGDDEYIMNMQEELSVALGIGNPQTRRLLYEKYKRNKNINFPTLIDPSVNMGNSVKMGIGNIICTGNVLTVDICIGSFNIINLGCTVGHDVQMGDFNTVNPGTNISGNVIIGDLVEVGTGTKIIQEKRIGNGAVIGAGTVIIKNIPCNAVAVGVPAVVKKYIDRGVLRSWH